MATQKAKSISPLSYSRIGGIDPGIDGGIACIDNGGAKAVRMPTKQVKGLLIEKGIVNPANKRLIDGTALLHILEEWAPEIIFMELVNSMPGDGKNGVLGAGIYKGAVIAVIEMCSIQVVTVYSQTWQSNLFGKIKRDKELSTADRRKLRKQISIDHSRLHYPQIDLRPGRCENDQDGISDAVCIADFGRKWCGNKIEK